MTIKEALQICDDLKPNSYETATKIRWLSEIEMLIRDEILITHTGCPAAPYGYSLLREKPADWEKNFSDYFTKEDGEYAANTSEVWAENTYFSNKPEHFDGYDGEDAANKSLFVNSPYDGVYPYYLQMMIDRSNGDTDRYVQSASAFSAAFNSLAQYWNRTHMALQHNQKMKFMRR